MIKHKLVILVVLSSFWDSLILFHWASFSAMLNSLKIPGMNRVIEMMDMHAENQPAAVYMFQRKSPTPMYTPSWPMEIIDDWMTRTRLVNIE